MSLKRAISQVITIEDVMFVMEQVRLIMLSLMNVKYVMNHLISLKLAHIVVSPVIGMILVVTVTSLCADIVLNCALRGHFISKYYDHMVLTLFNTPLHLK